MLNPPLNAEVEVGKDVGPTEPEHEEHLRAPASDPLHADERRGHLVVRHRVERLDRELAGGDLRREILDVGDLLPGEAGGAKALVVGGEDLLRRRGAIAVQGFDATVDRRRGLARELLVDDRADERIEVAAARARGELARADAVDDARELRITLAKVVDGGLVHAEKISRRCEVG